MSIVRHTNPFPDIWATFVTWNAERKRIANLPFEERRAYKAAIKATTRNQQQAYREQRWPAGSLFKQYMRNLRNLQDQASSNFWGIIRHATYVRLALCCGVFYIFASQHMLVFFGIGVSLHLLFYTEFAGDGGVATRLARCERMAVILMAALGVVAVASFVPVWRTFVLELLLPCVIGALAPVAYGRQTPPASGLRSPEWLKTAVATFLDVILFFTLITGLQSIEDEQFASFFQDSNWRLCNPIIWTTNSLDTPTLLAALDRDDDVGTCYVVDGVLDGITPLHMAVGLGDNPYHIETLTSRGADINALRRGTVTPLHDAASRKADPEPFIAMLLDLGADPTIRNDKGQTAADLAMGNQAISDSLVRHLYAIEEVWHDNIATDKRTGNTPERDTHGG